MDITREEYVEWLESKGFRYSHTYLYDGDIHEIRDTCVSIPDSIIHSINTPR
jgi:hypothetical protein